MRGAARLGSAAYTPDHMFAKPDPAITVPDWAMAIRTAALAPRSDSAVVGQQFKNLFNDSTKDYLDACAPSSVPHLNWRNYSDTRDETHLYERNGRMFVAAVTQAYGLASELLHSRLRVEQLQRQLHAQTQLASAATGTVVPTVTPVAPLATVAELMQMNKMQEEKHKWQASLAIVKAQLKAAEEEREKLQAKCVKQNLACARLLARDVKWQAKCDGLTQQTAKAESDTESARSQVRQAADELKMAKVETSQLGQKLSDAEARCASLSENLSRIEKELSQLHDADALRVQQEHERQLQEQLEARRLLEQQESERAAELQLEVDAQLKRDRDKRDKEAASQAPEVNLDAILDLDDDF